MEIKKKIVVPTGEIYTAIGEKGMLEFLTVGDYGKNANIKADFLGITRDLNGVPNGEPMPLTEKWVITISTQYGCSMGCKFCDVPKVGIGRNATFNDLKGEVLTAIKQHPEVKHTKRLNIHYARMGEPTWNANVLLHAISVKKDIEPFIGDSLVHPVISTMLPKRNKKLVEFLHKWCYYIKNELYKGDAGLQFSINTTNDEERNYLFSGSSLSLGEISEIGKSLPMPKRRREYSCVFNNWAIFFNPLCPASLPFGFRRKVPNGNARSSTTINRFSTGMFSFCNQYRTALPLRFIKVFGFSTIKSQFFTRMRAIAPYRSSVKLPPTLSTKWLTTRKPIL